MPTASLSTDKKSPVSVHVEASATLAMKSRMAALNALGVDAISLGAGQLGNKEFPLADDIRKAFIYYAENGPLGYTAAPGDAPIRRAVAVKAEQDYGISYNPNKEILMTDGGKGALLPLFLTTFAGKYDDKTFDGRDEILYPAPYWLSHNPLVKVSQGILKPVDCPASQDYKITPEQLRNSITDKTKFVVLTSPHNPGGTSYTEAEWKALADILKDFPDVYVVTEDMYEHYVYDGQERTHFLKAAPEMKERTISVNCFSKSDEMAGERIGWLTGPEHIIAKVKKLNSNILGNAPVVGQQLGVAAILGFEQFKLAYENPKAFEAQFQNKEASQEAVQEFNRVSEIRNQKIVTLENLRDRVLAEFAKTDLVTPKPSGSFYAFPSVEKLKGLKFPADLKLAKGLTNAALEKLKLKSWAGQEITCAADFAEAVMVHAGVGIVPGEDFEAPDSFRIAYVEERAVEAAGRIAELANKLEPAI